MNARVTPPAVTPSLPARTPRVVSGRDREFLPAALEILETPPPPLPIALISTICLFALRGACPVDRWAAFEIPRRRAGEN